MIFIKIIRGFLSAALLLILERLNIDCEFAVEAAEKRAGELS
jgi:hypothetical protein